MYNIDSQIDALIPDQSKFIALLLHVEVPYPRSLALRNNSQNIAWNDLIDRPRELGSGVIVSPTIPFDGLKEFMLKVLGEHFEHYIDDFNLILLSPYNDDQKQTEARRFLHDLYYTIRLLGMKYKNDAIWLSGFRNGDEAQSTSLGRDSILLGPWKLPYKSKYSSWQGVEPVPLTNSSLQKAYSIAKKLNSIDFTFEKYERLALSLESWIRGVRESEKRERIHQFVRSIEALTPIKSFGKNKFADHAHDFFVPLETQQFVGGRGIEPDYLRFLYDVRSKIEHNAQIKDVIPGFDQTNPGFELLNIAMKVEMMASFILKRILENNDLLNYYEDNDTISRLFVLNEKEKRSLWGSRYNVEKEILDRRNKFGI